MFCVEAVEILVKGSRKAGRAVVTGGAGGGGGGGAGSCSGGEGKGSFVQDYARCLSVLATAIETSITIESFVSRRCLLSPPLSVAAMSSLPCRPPSLCRPAVLTRHLCLRSPRLSDVYSSLVRVSSVTIESSRGKERGLPRELGRPGAF